MAVEPGPDANPTLATAPPPVGAGATVSRSYGSAPPPTPVPATGGDNPMGVLISGILLLGGIALFIGWGLTHAYPTT
jgi:LPXTG-motif cell wall-anchored protein